MKIKEIRAVNVNIPQTPPKTESRRPTWNKRAPRALPINKYPEFSPIAEPNARHGRRTGVGTDHH